MPEGTLIHTRENDAWLTPTGLMAASVEGRTLEGRVAVCDAEHNLIVDLNGITGIIPRNEAAIGIQEGATREIAIISRVGKPVCFKVKKIITDSEGQLQAILSRREAQEEALTYLMVALRAGDVIKGVVTHLEHFGAFVDIGCGIVSLLGIENISVARIFHSNERLSPGQVVYAVVSEIDKTQRRITLSHKELLGTWEENAKLFSIGETVPGIVRGIKEYGIFIELTPNLSGLSEYRDNLENGDSVSVFIKAIIPERMKIKLVTIEKLDSPTPVRKLKYYITGGHMDFWRYSPKEYIKPPVETAFITLF